MAVELAAGRTNACVRLDKGGVACWGANEHGVDGDGTVLDPVDQGGVAGLPAPAASICVGALHACAALDDGSVWCWGNNGGGQIGMGAPIPAGATSAVRVAGNEAFADVVQVACGDVHSCARTREGAVWCWGRNTSGQLGATPSATPQPLPIRVIALPPVVDLAAGMSTTCAIVGDTSEVRCWGEGEDGAFGTSASEPDSAAPMAVVLPMEPAVDVAVGRGHVCARTLIGNVWCWGRNDYGETGTIALGINAPTQVSVGMATGITAGASHTCAWGEDGVLGCWGSNVHGELGLPPDATVRDQPALMPGITASAAAGESFTCATRGGVVECWGMNRWHTLGRAAAPFVALPRRVAGVTGVTEVALGGGHTCFVAAGTTSCCGGNSVGAIGNGGAPLDESAPQLALGAPTGLFALGAGDATTCARTSESELICWGANESLQAAVTEPAALIAPQSSPSRGPYEEISGGRATTCGRSLGRIDCWGAGDRGQLGDRSATTMRSVPSQVADISMASALALGSDHGCAIDGGAVKCWGAGGDGRLGPLDAGDALAPQAVGIDDAIAIGAHGARTCVVRGGGAGVWCWAAGSAAPAFVPGSEAATQVTVGAAHACFLAAAEAAVWCWGSNRAGQLGDGTRVDRIDPSEVDLPRVSVVRAGAEHTCAISGIDLYCWGATGAGRICDDSLVRDFLPQPIAGSAVR